MSTKDERTSKPERVEFSPGSTQPSGPSKPQEGPPGKVAQPPGLSPALDQVREILFGSVQRELERRLARAEAHVAARATELEQGGRQRTEVIESHLHKETEALSARLEREITTTADALRGLTRDQREAVTTLEQRVAKLEDAMLRSERQTRQAMLDQAKSFLDELHRLRTELLVLIQQEFELGPEPPEEAVERHAP